MLHKTHSWLKRRPFHPSAVAGYPFSAGIEVRARANGDNPTQAMTDHVLSRLSCALTIGHGHGIEISISQQLVEGHGMNARGDDVAERICSTINGSDKQTIDLPAD